MPDRVTRRLNTFEERQGMRLGNWCSHVGLGPGLLRSDSLISMHFAVPQGRSQIREERMTGRLTVWAGRGGWAALQWQADIMADQR